MTRPLILAGALLALVLAVVLVVPTIPRKTSDAVVELVRGPPPETLIQTTLSTLQREEKLVVLSVGLIGTIASRQDRVIGTARKTMLVPGVVRYAIDLSAIDDGDLDWDGEAQQLIVRRPPLQLLGPEIDPARIQEFREIGLLPQLMGAEARLDEANRAAAREAVLQGARNPELLRQADDAGNKALARAFELPLHAAGFTDVTVEVVARR
ncbi:MAG: DUF4230 domain-containing protein [Thermaurantiacus sp.]